MGVCVPAGLIVRVRDDNELRVGDDGCPLLLPGLLVGGQGGGGRGETHSNLFLISRYR